MEICAYQGARQAKDLKKDNEQVILERQCCHKWLGEFKWFCFNENKNCNRYVNVNRF